MATKKYTFLFTLADGTTHNIPIEIPTGEDGGYYLPKITQVSDSEIEIDFIPNEPGMPSVDSVRLKLKDYGGNVSYDEVQELTEEQKAQARENIGAQPKGNYLESAALSEAINTALSQAKDTGMFDGKDGIDGKDGADGYTPQKNVDYFDGKDGKDGADGQPGKDGQDYVLTDADRNEIAEMAADLVEVPESSGGGIAVTGATVGQTVKISAVDENGVPTAWEATDFPSGGGSGSVAVQEIISTGTLDFSTAYTTNELPVSMEKLREYKIFGIAVKPSVSTNYTLCFGKTSGEPNYGANGIKSLTIVCEWLDDAKTVLKLEALSNIYQNNPFTLTSNPYQMIRGFGSPFSFPSVGTENMVTLMLSVAQTSEVSFCVWGVIK